MYFSCLIKLLQRQEEISSNYNINKGININDDSSINSDAYKSIEVAKWNLKPIVASSVGVLKYQKLKQTSRIMNASQNFSNINFLDMNLLL